jgi:tetratricopeptide (TPR) repeat protein
MERRTDDSIAAFRRALSLNPNSAVAHSHLSRALAFAGHDREAIEHGEEAIRLSPRDPERPLFLGAVATAHYLARRYAEAAACASEAFKLRAGVCASRSPRRSAGTARADPKRAAPTVDRLDQAYGAVSDAGVDGAVSQGYAQGRATRKLSGPPLRFQQAHAIRARQRKTPAVEAGFFAWK